MYTWGSFSKTPSSVPFFGHETPNFNDIDTPTVVAKLKGKVKYMSLGWIHAGAVTFDGDTYTWGDGDTWRLGHGIVPRDEKHLTSPTLVKTLKGKDVVQLSLARGNESALTKSGEVFVWGGAEYGGHHNFSVPTPVQNAFQFEMLLGGRVNQVSSGKSHSAIITTLKMSLVVLCVRNIAKRSNFSHQAISVLPTELQDLLISFRKLHCPL